MLENLTKEIKAQLYERARSPLTGAFSISWIAWNFKPIVILLSNEALNSKFNLWSAYYSSNADSVLFGFVYPLLSAVFYILFYPYPARWAYEYWYLQHKETKRIQQKIEDETPLTQEESRAIRITSIQEMTKMQEELGVSATTNRELTNKNRELLEQLAELKKENIQIRSELDEYNFREALEKSPVYEDDENLIQEPYSDDPKVVLASDEGGVQALNELNYKILEQLSLFENQGQNWISPLDLLSRIVPRDITGGKIALHELESKKLVSQSGMGQFSLTHSGRIALKKHSESN